LNKQRPFIPFDPTNEATEENEDDD